MRIGSVENPASIFGYALFGAAFGSAGVFFFRQNPIVGLIFGGLGALLVFVAIHAYLGRQRYGELVLDVDEPVVPGGQFKARLVVPGRAAARTIQAELRCKKVEARKRGLTESILWSAKQSFPMEGEIRFTMPADAPLSEGGTTATRTTPGIYWELQVETGDEPGVDLMRGFRFPVVAGTPAPSAILRPGVPPVTPSPEKAARSVEAKRRALAVSKASGCAALAGGAAVLAWMYWGQPTGVQMRRALVAVVALAMAVYWIGSYRNWLRDKVDEPGTPPLTPAFVWHMLVLAAIAWQFL